MRLSDAGLRRRQTKLIYLDHRPPPWLIEDATPRSLEPFVSGRTATSNAASSETKVRPASCTARRNGCVAVHPTNSIFAARGWCSRTLPRNSAASESGATLVSSSNVVTEAPAIALA